MTKITHVPSLEVAAFLFPGRPFYVDAESYHFGSPLNMRAFYEDGKLVLEGRGVVSAVSIFGAPIALRRWTRIGSPVLELMTEWLAYRELKFVTPIDVEDHSSLGPSED